MYSCLFNTGPVGFLILDLCSRRGAKSRHFTFFLAILNLLSLVYLVFQDFRFQARMVLQVPDEIWILQYLLNLVDLICIVVISSLLLYLS